MSHKHDQNQQELKQPGSDPEIIIQSPKDKDKSILVHKSEIFSSWQGPMPSPDVLKAYNDIVPGSASLLFEQFVKQSDHRIQIEKTVINSNTKLDARGQMFGFIVIMLFSIAGFYLVIFKNQKIEGFISLMVPLSTIVIQFINRKTQSQKEMKEKKEETNKLDNKKK
jgi:uncharacterized membrane protein